MLKADMLEDILNDFLNHMQNKSPSVCDLRSKSPPWKQLQLTIAVCFVRYILFTLISAYICYMILNWTWVQKELMQNK